MVAGGRGVVAGGRGWSQVDAGDPRSRSGAHVRKASSKRQKRVLNGCSKWVTHAYPNLRREEDLTSGSCFFFLSLTLEKKQEPNRLGGSLLRDLQGSHMCDPLKPERLLWEVSKKRGASRRKEKHSVLVPPPRPPPRSPPRPPPHPPGYVAATAKPTRDPSSPRPRDFPGWCKPTQRFVFCGDRIPDVSTTHGRSIYTNLWRPRGERDWYANNR